VDFSLEMDALAVLFAYARLS